MRILFVAPAYKAFRLRGSVLVASALAEALARHGHDVTVFATNSNSDEFVDDDLDVPLDRFLDMNGVRVRYFRRMDNLKRRLRCLPYLTRSMGWLYAPTMVPALRHWVPRVDLVHTHLPFVYPTYAAAREAWRRRKPLFYHQHGALAPQLLKYRAFKKNLYLAGIERPILRRATTLVALSAGEIASYRAQGVRTPCRVVPNAIDVQDPRCSARPDSDKRWQLPAGARVVLFLGRLHASKGVDLLLEAFFRIADQCRSVVLILAGPDEGGFELRYRSAIQLAGLAARVRFTGMVLGDDKLDLLARADLFCLPSVGEGFSMAILEALASATPVLISPECHFPEAQAAGAARIVPRQAESIARALVELLADAGQLQAMGRAGEALVRRQYSWEQIAARLTAVYEEGLQRQRS